jgi:malonyl-CoA O-methyltransferase
MHDWGDMLVQAGFAEPVMDMERITLTFRHRPQRLLRSCASWAQPAPGRFAACAGAAGAPLMLAAAGPAGRPPMGGWLALTFEIIYGHALKPAPRLPRAASETSVSLDDMRALLQGV